jgi:hypothetical protein
VLLICREKEAERLFLTNNSWTFVSLIKKNKIMFFAGKWMELETITLSKISQIEKDKYYTFSLRCGFQP